MYVDCLKKVQSRNHLDSDEAELLLQAIFDQQLSEIQMAALLSALAAKGETVEEIVGFARGMRRFAVALKHTQQRLVDTAGTGGDASGTFNISTAAAFVIAGAGVPVAKHGNRAMSGKCGSADVLSHLGVNLEAPLNVLEDCLAKGRHHVFVRADVSPSNEGCRQSAAGAWVFVPCSICSVRC